MLPLRLDKSSGVFSFVFVDEKKESEIEQLKKKNGWNHLSAYRISHHTFQSLLNECEKIYQPDAIQAKTIALVEKDSNYSKALQTILTSQNYDVIVYPDFESLFKTATQEKSPQIDVIVSHHRNISNNEAVESEISKYFPKSHLCILKNEWIKPLLLSEPIESELDFHIKHDNFFRAALACFKQGNIFRAVELLEQVPSESPDFLKAQLFLGKAFLKKKNYNKATQHFQKAYDHWCEDPDGIVDETTLSILYYLGISFERLNRYDDALRLFERVAGENPLYKQVNHEIAKIKEIQRKANQTREKKEGFPAFSTTHRERSRYERIDEIGRGGMGIVYRSRDRILGREVALKILNSHFKHDEKIVETFLREAKSLAALNHLHIVTVFDAGIEDGNYYISMEFIEGKTIRELLKKKGHFKLATTVALAKQVLKALSYAHSKRVIHRDITTNNMMLTDSKIVKLMDFGLARVVNQLHSEQSIIGGTPYFMSPEQVEGAPIDHRTDLYSFGVCLYEMLTGQVPFPMENPGYHHLHTNAPDPRLIKPELPEKMARIILKCLEKKPDHRYKNAAEILELLKILPSNDSETSTTSKERQRTK